MGAVRAAVPFTSLSIFTYTSFHNGPNLGGGIDIDRGAIAGEVVPGKERVTG